MFNLLKIIIFLLLLIIYNFKYNSIINRIISYKKKDRHKIKNQEVINPYLSIIIYCLNENSIDNLIKTINYDKNKYEIIVLCSKDFKFDRLNKVNKKMVINHNNTIYQNLKLSFKYLDKKSKYVAIFDNNTLLIPNTLYDMIKLLQQHHLNSVSCLCNYPNYKENFINNVYYHYKYLDTQTNQNPIFGQIISTKVLSSFGKKELKPIVLQKNLLNKNIPKVVYIPNEISFSNYQSLDKTFIFEILYFCLAIISINFSYLPFLIFVFNLWIYQYKASNINYGINDFNIYQSFYLLILKLIVIPINLIHLVTFNYFSTISYSKLEYSNFLRPEISEKNNYTYGYQCKLKNYNFDIVKLKGTHYQMGFTIGEIYREELIQNLKLLDMLLPPFEINPLWRNYGYKAKTILKKIKDHSWSHISEKNKQELKGISEGSNTDFEDIILLSLFPCLFKAHCTILLDENIFLRTLDVDFKNKKASICIYQPDKGNKYLTLTSPGLNWCVTGFSENLIIGEVFNDYCEISENKDGSPFFFNFKDILIEANDLNQTKKIIERLKWNDSIDIAISSVKNNNSYFIEKRGNNSIFFSEKNFGDYLKKYSKTKINNDRCFSFYYNLDLMYNIINQYDKLTVDDVYHSIIRGLETGLNHSLILDKKSKKVYISTANSDKEGYLRQMIEFNFDELFSK